MALNPLLQSSLLPLQADFPELEDQVAAAVVQERPAEQQAGVQHDAETHNQPDACPGTPSRALPVSSANCATAAMPGTVSAMQPASMVHAT